VGTVVLLPVREVRIGHGKSVGWPMIGPKVTPWVSVRTIGLAARIRMYGCRSRSFFGSHDRSEGDAMEPGH
jgi:hypothetical protein